MVQLFVTGISNSFNDIAANATNSAIFQRADFLHQIIHCHAACEDRGGGVLDREVRESASKQAVGHADAHEAVVDKELAAHQSVDKELLDKLESTIVGENVLVRRILRRLVELFSDPVGDIARR